MRWADVVVVGAGIMGSATARAAARRGRDVVLLERFELGHARGSSHGRSRIFRFSYAERRYVRMAMEALPLWRELEEEADEEILRTTGGIDLGARVDRHASALAEEGAVFEVLDPSEAARRFPAVAFPAGSALFQPDAGIVLADRARDAFQRTARDAGAEIVPRRPARRLATDDGRVTVETDDQTYRASAVVVTAGSWVRELVEPVGIEVEVRPTRETVAYFEFDESAEVPSLVEWSEPAGYALRSPGQGIKAGEHGTGPDADPNREASPRREAVERVAAWVRRRFPDVDPEPHLAETCLYTNTRDESFIVERHGPVVIGSPCSGHGFKFAPWIGRRLADLATSG